MKRFLFSLAIVVIIVAAIVAPASAAPYHPNAEIVDYVQFIDSVEANGENDIVNMTFPSSLCYCAVYDSIGERYTYQRLGDYVQFVTYSDAVQSPIFFPVGWLNTRRLSLAGIPDGTWFKFRYDVSVVSSKPIVFGDRSINTRISYWDKDGYFLSEQITQSVTTEDSGYISVVISDIPENAVSCALQIEFWSVRSISSDSVTVTVSLSDFVLQMSLSALQVQSDLTLYQQELIKEINKNQLVTHEKLEAIQEQQQITNDKMDEIMDYQPTPDTPDWQDSVDQYEKVEQDAMQNVQSGMRDSDKVFKSVFNILGDYVQSFAAVSILFNTFGDIPFFRALLYVSLSLGIVAAILGIGIDAARSSARSSARSTRKARSG